jgi:hypothetical protein
MSTKLRDPKSILIRSPRRKGDREWQDLTLAAECVRVGGSVPERCRALAVKVLRAARPKQVGRRRDFARAGEAARRVAAGLAAGLGKVEAVERAAEEMGLDARRVWRLVADFEV